MSRRRCPSPARLTRSKENVVPPKSHPAELYFLFFLTSGEMFTFIFRLRPTNVQWAGGLAWIRHRPPEPATRVRIPAGPPLRETNMHAPFSNGVFAARTAFGPLRAYEGVCWPHDKRNDIHVAGAVISAAKCIDRCCIVSLGVN